MELARPASSSKQQAAPQGPFWAPEQQGPRNRKKMLPRYPGWLSATFLHLRFDQPDSQGREIAKCWFLRPFWPRAAPWQLEKLRTETRKMQYTGAGALFGKNPVRPKSFSQKGQLFYMLHFGQTDPHRREIAKYGVSRHFWPRAALGT